MSVVRYVAIGDSFTEGVGDEPEPGVVRGWADLVAQGWSVALGQHVEYANFAIRGKLAWQIVEEQLEPALALRPTHLSYNGGGNDMLRARVPFARVAEAFSHVLRRCDEEGVRFILLSGSNPSSQLPLGGVVQRRGDQLSAIVEACFADRDDIVRAFNWSDRVLSAPRYWAPDRLHLNARGHHRVAARVLEALGLEPQAEWWDHSEVQVAPRLGRVEHLREYLGPWVRRRLTGTSSGDGREPKFPTFTTVGP